MTIEYSLYHPVTREILWSGIAVDESKLPEVPPEYSEYRFAIGVRGDPEKEGLDVTIIDGVEHYSLFDQVPPRSEEVLQQVIEDERAKRLAAGFDYNFKDERGVHRIGTTEADERGWDKVTKLASAMILSGNPGGKIQVVTETGPVEVTAVEWQEILIAAGAFQQPIYALSFALQTMTPIPQDVENPSYWGQN